MMTPHCSYSFLCSVHSRIEFLISSSGIMDTTSIFFFCYQLVPSSLWSRSPDEISSGSMDRLCVFMHGDGEFHPESNRTLWLCHMWWLDNPSGIVCVPMEEDRLRGDGCMVGVAGKESAGLCPASHRAHGTKQGWDIESFHFRCAFCHGTCATTDGTNQLLLLCFSLLQAPPFSLSTMVVYLCGGYRVLSSNHIIGIFWNYGEHNYFSFFLISKFVISI